MNRFEFIADDFGRDSETNSAIIHAYQNGVLTGTALMMGQEGTERAVQLARENSALQLGFHLHLCDSTPLTITSWPWGNSPARAGWSIGMYSWARELALNEIRAQWLAYQQFELPCHFINSHHHLHVHPWIRSRLFSLVNNSFQGWVRLGRPRFFEGRPFTNALLRGAYRLHKRSEIATPETLWGVDRTFKMNDEEVRSAMKSLTSGWHEFIFHPRKMSNDKDLECLIALKHGLG